MKYVWYNKVDLAKELWRNGRSNPIRYSHFMKCLYGEDLKLIFEMLMHIVNGHFVFTNYGFKYVLSSIYFLQRDDK